ncbi:MAG: TetR/AcrR family transcriptional regulator [Acidobacteria bacterium]|nr:TetR/AcrR family transcriptional regulator [Acidobacteriota bacterium]MBI3425440.1 TetR/AcrR family transcriptional regulator [Acidobacteriota bacterium]
MQGTKLAIDAKVPIKLSRLGEDERLLLIYRTAARVIHEKGYDATSLNEIADAVGITKGGLYHYIDGKKSLLFKVMSYALDMLELEVQQPAESLADAEQQLRAVLKLHTQLIIDKGIEMTILLDESAGLTVADRQLIAARRTRYYKFVRAIVERLKHEGKLHDLDVTVATHNLIGQLQWLARWYSSAGRLTRAQVIEEFTKAALTGLLRPKTRAPLRTVAPPATTARRGNSHPVKAAQRSRK